MRAGSIDHTDYDAPKYFYVKNQQVDVVQLLNDNLEVVANYTYNAWGLPLSVTDASGNAITGVNHPGNMNPIRYRGYYYDSETGFYYCGSRYYDPESCRFISPDTTDVLTVSLTAMTDKNLYAYCDNNPVMRADYGGEFWSELKAFGAECLKVAIITTALALSVSAIGSAAIVTTASGGTAAGSLLLAVQFSEVALTTAATVAITGIATMEIAEVGETIAYAKAGDGISEHTNGSKNWDKHSKKRSGDKEKGDKRRRERIDKKKRNQNKNSKRNTIRNRRR